HLLQLRRIEDHRALQVHGDAYGIGVDFGAGTRARTHLQPPAVDDLGQRRGQVDGAVPGTRPAGKLQHVRDDLVEPPYVVTDDAKQAGVDIAVATAGIGQ